MGKHDRCAVHGCGNSRNKPEKVLRKNHVGILRWHTARTFQQMKLWEKMLNRQDDFKMTINTKVCSNHFAAGYCSDVSPIPTLYLKGYDVEEPLEHKGPIIRTRNFEYNKQKKNVIQDRVEILKEDKSSISTPFIGDHSYENNIPK